MLTQLFTLIGLVDARRRLAADERGAISAETVILTAILAGLALVVGGIIVAKVTAKANSIQLD